MPKLLNGNMEEMEYIKHMSEVTCRSSNAHPKEVLVINLKIVITVEIPLN